MSPSRTPVTHQPDARSGRRNQKPPVQNIRVQTVSSTRRNHRVNAGVQLIQQTPTAASIIFKPVQRMGGVTLAHILVDTRDNPR